MSNREIPINEKGKGADQDFAERGVESGQNAGKLEARIAELEQENQQLRDRALRAVADLENFRRRAEQERYQTVQYANERLLKDLLPIVDDFRRSVQAGEQSSDFDAFFKGVAMVSDKINRTLESLGVKKIESVGQPFNVNFHEALMRQPSDAPEDTVITELEPGYMYGDRVLRHAKVIVSAGN